MRGGLLTLDPGDPFCENLRKLRKIRLKAGCSQDWLPHKKLTNCSHRRPTYRTAMGIPNPNPELLKGTLDMLVLKTLTRGPNHGYGIAQHIRRVSEEAFRVGEGSLYPALQRLLVNGWARAEWAVTETNRKARVYTITAAGKKRLTEEVREFDFVLAAIARVMESI
jgi:PadR family transcriptional regulator, regulatory protein PadR